jgi:osmotically-inducible protein OsmY
MIKTDLQLKQDIEAELHWDPKVNAAQIGVTVNEGGVSLLGTVDTYAEKWAAEKATKRVAGVRAVAEELTVKLMGPHQKSDAEIASSAQQALEWDVWVPKSVTAKIHEGRVTLEGEVEWNFQRHSALRAVRYLTGVSGVTNNITIKASVSVGEVKDNVRAALQRQAAKDASSIHVDTSGGTVTLTGKASSWHVIEDAAAAAWAAPGVTKVVDTVSMSGF